MIRGGWGASVAVYAAFAAAVFVAQGAQPLLGADHISYIKLADTIYAACPDGRYWRELNSVRTFSVLLAAMQGWTGSYVLSMKIVLAVFSVPYLLATELLFREFASRWHAMLFALVSSFAISFGVSSWGITDSTALLARTLVAPAIMLSTWVWFHYDGQPARYVAFPILILGSVLHLSAFYMLAILLVVEVLDFLFLRRMKLDRLVLAAAGWLSVSLVLLLALEIASVSSQLIGVQVPSMLRALGFDIENIEDHQPPGCGLRMAISDASPAAVVPRIRLRTATVLPLQVDPGPLSAAEAWKAELALRPWRNMPMPLVNVANILSSSALILLLALAGLVSRWRAGFTRPDRLMLAMFVAVPLVALGPQTLLWILRSFTSIRPVNIEEFRALGLVMIPAFYFVLRLFQGVLAAGGPRARVKASAIVVAALALPLTMKGMPQAGREMILSAMAALHVVDPANEAAVTNARAALGLTGGAVPLYYSTLGVRQWLAAHTPPGARILTDRDDMILLRERVIVGPRQVGATTFEITRHLVDTYLRTSRAIQTKDTARVMELARAYGADFAVVPWPVAGAAYADEWFSVIAVNPAPLRATR